MALPTPCLTPLVSLARLARLFACAGVLTTSLPATAQVATEGEPAAPPEQSPAASPAPPEYVADDELPEVVVTGFRRSLGAALQKKQRATGQIDAIVADDIADFPDLNLAESLQRIPGIAISRTNGEGSNITVRGLGGLYTRIRLNGMEVRAAVGNSNFQTNGRNFDFNLFASELFNSIVVHKTASADLDEGSLGSVVDLNTARAFNYDEGFTFVAGATAVYNDLSDMVRPRLTGLVAYRDPAGIWGASASAAYTRVHLESANTETIGWQRAAFHSVNGVVCGDVLDDPGCLEVADAHHPRIPRFAQNRTTGDRLGLTAGVQFRPTDHTELRLDGLFATYPNRTENRRLFVLFRGNEATTDLRDYVLQRNPDRFGVGNDSLIAGTVDNAWVRSEHVRLDAEARFHQLSLAVDHRFSDSFFVNALAGTSRNLAGLSHDTTFNYDNRAYNGYRFDFTNDKAPVLAFQGLDVTDPATFIVPELRDRVGTVEGGYDTLELNLHYDIFDELKLAAGVNFKRASLENKPSNRDGTLCTLNLFECQDTDADGTDDIIGPPGDPALSDLVEYPGEVGAGANSRWTSPSIDDWARALDYYNVPLTVDQNGTNKVTENNLGYYLQARGEVMLGLGNMRVQYDGGMRYVETRQSSSGFNSGLYVTVDRPTYHDWLPSANAALWLTDELVVRLAAARVMARPGLDQLSPGGTVDPTIYQVNFQNPNLDPTRATALDAAAEWYFADSSILSVALFSKDIDSFPIRQSRRGTFASTGLPRAVIIPLSPADASGPGAEGTCGDPVGCWDISELTGGPGATVKGLELAFQAPFNAFYGGLPPVLRDMGIVANYTYVDSTANYDFLGTPVTERLLGLSNGQYNATLYYEDSKFSARVSLAYRSDFLTAGPNQNENLWAYTEAETRVDFSSSYNVTDHLKVSLEGLNLSDTPGSSRVDIDAERRNNYSRQGRTFLLGARVSY
ncbi:MAG: TonB-dependent receptor [Deltaproteobacteria bacterium]